MQSTTLAIAVLGCVLVLTLRFPYALAAYIAALAWYPNYLRISIGTIDISVGRIVVSVLLLRCLLNDRIRCRFVWSRLDKWVTLSMAVCVGIWCLMHPSLQASLENRSGFLMDTWFAYIVVRLIMTDRATLISFAKATGVVLAPLAILGVSECITGEYFFLALKRFRPWGGFGGSMPAGRWGLTRANGPFSHSIMFGGCFAMFLPLIWALRYQRDHWGKLAYLMSGAVILGVLSSMSSGPWVMLIAVILCLAMANFRHWVKPLLVGFMALCIAIGIISNRPFYHVLYSYLNPVGGEWYQRARLVDYGIETLGQWWLGGYGGRDPGWGRAAITGKTDVNNEFLLAGVNYGLLGIIALCGVLVQAFSGLSRAFRKTQDVELKSLYWCLGSSLVGVIAIWQGVTFFGQMPSLFYSFLGIIGSSFALAESAGAQREELLGRRVNYPVLSL